MTKTLSRRRQQGATLIVGLIMLILMTLIALSAIRLSNTNLRIVGNEQFRNEAQAAAEYALDTAANSATFASANTTTTTVSVGLADYTVTVNKPDCKRYRTIPKAELVTSSSGIPVIAEGDVPCFTGSSSSPLTIVNASALGGSAGESLCAGTLWEVQSTAIPTDATGTTVAVSEGIEVRMTVPDAQSACK